MLDFPLIGRWIPGQIKARSVQSSRQISPPVEKEIENAWKLASARPEVHLFDGPMCRLESFDVSNDLLTLDISPTSYKVFVGTNLNLSNLPPKCDAKYLANPIGLSAALISSDGYLIMGRRNDRVAYYPGRIHPFAGSMEPGKNVDVFDEIRRELREELEFVDEDVREVICAGIAEDRSLRQPEMVFIVWSNLKRMQIESRLSSDEHVSPVGIPLTEGSMETALVDPISTPVGIAAMLLAGRHCFGNQWHAEMFEGFITK